MNKLTIAGLYVLFAVIIALLGYIAFKEYHIGAKYSIEMLEKKKIEYIAKRTARIKYKMKPEEVEAYLKKYNVGMNNKDLTSQDVSEFFKTDVSLDKAHLKYEYILTWAALSMSDIMTFGFNDYEARLAHSSRYFTDNGWHSFSKTIDGSRVIEMVNENEQIITAAPMGAPVLESSGVVGGKYQWGVQMPMILTVRSGAKTLHSNLLVTIYIVRSNDPKHPYGIAIDKWLAAAR